MTDRRSDRLLHAPSLGVFDVRCSAPAGGPGPEEDADVTQVVLPVDGVFEVHRGRDMTTVDAASVIVFAPRHEHRVGHPVAGGDRSLVLVFPPEVVDEALGSDGAHAGPVGPLVHLASRVLGSTLRRDASDELGAEELAFRLLGWVRVDLGLAGSYRPRGPHQRERVERVRALLAAVPDRRWRLDELARAVSCSPFHLARQFRAVAGTSIWTHLLRLRLALALSRLAEGESDLAGLAAHLGFASQSHFGARFRSVFGCAPGALRDSLTAGRLAELRTFVTAAERAAS